jgi:hypothetical protein
VRRPCTLFKVARSALSYQGRKAAKSAPVVERMKELSARYPRYGLRKQLSAWMLCAAMSLTACDGAAPYDGTIWDNPLPASAYPGPVPIHGTYYSSAMNVNVGYNVVLPPEYDSHPNARFPRGVCFAWRWR